MSSPPLDNQTEFAAEPLRMLTRQGERLVVMVKGTFELRAASGTLALAAEQRARPIRFADVAWGEPDVSSILYPADVCPFKPGTDVIGVARAYAPGGKPVPSFDVLFQVGPLKKAARVYGLRVWEANGAGLSSPHPVSELDMRYENAWGGFDDSDPARVTEEPRNPVGRGCVRDAARLTHQPAPCIEDPATPIANHRTRPPPAGIGAIGRHWEPRRRYIGTYDEVWEKSRSPLPPKDQDDRLFLCASPGLTASAPLRGGEDVSLLNLTPGGGATRFQLPRVALELEFRVRGRSPEVERPFVDTVLIDTLVMAEGFPLTVELVWRASVKAPRRAQDALTLVREVAPA